MEVEFHPRVRIRIKAKDQPAVQAKLRALMKPGEAFFQRLSDEFCQQIVNSENTSLSTAGWLCVDDPAPAGTSEWDFEPFDDGTPDDDANLSTGVAETPGRFMPVRHLFPWTPGDNHDHLIDGFIASPDVTCRAESAARSRAKGKRSHPHGPRQHS